MLTAIDCFSGIGGFAIACDWLNIKTSQFIEINPMCQEVLAKHYPDVPIHSDIKTYSPSISADIVMGGSPCQNLSQAGKGEGIEGDRSSLWFEQLRIINECKPNFAIWENVYGAYTSGALRVVMRGLYQSGYRFDAQIVSAQSVGAPHQRKRIFVVAYANSLVKPSRSQILQSWADQYRSQNAIARSFGVWRSQKPPVYGVGHGLPHRLDKLAMLGNSIVPQCALIPLMRALYLHQELCQN